MNGVLSLNLCKDKMKKIGIITIVRVNNYGAELQAYALQRKLANMGYDVELIDYLYYIHPNYVKEKKAVPPYAKYYPFVRRIKGILFPMIETVKSYMNKTIHTKRNARFIKPTLVFLIVMTDYLLCTRIRQNMMCIVLVAIRCGIRIVIHH